MIHFEVITNESIKKKNTYWPNVLGKMFLVYRIEYLSFVVQGLKNNFTKFNIPLTRYC